MQKKPQVPHINPLDSRHETWTPALEASLQAAEKRGATFIIGVVKTEQLQATYGKAKS